MRLLKGTVKSTIDLSNTGKFIVQSSDIDATIEVIYTSPYAMFNGGGVVAIPEIGSKIFFFEHENEYYYMSTIVDTPRTDQRGGELDAKVIGDKEVYKGGVKPHRVTYTNAVNSGLKITRHMLGYAIDSKVDLDSEKGKRLSLNDSSQINAIQLRTEHGDGVVISGKESDIYPSRSIEIKSVGPQNYVVFQSGIQMLVVDGREISIENHSTGAFANVGAEEKGKFGNINLRSKNSDINITADGKESRIFIVTPKARIQIEDDGTLSVSSANGINMLTDKSITLEAKEMISLKAAQINIKASANINTEAGGNASVKSGGTNSLDGSQVHFNSGLSQSVTIPSINITDKTDYGD